MRIIIVLLSAVVLVACAQQRDQSEFSGSQIGIVGGQDLKEGDTLASYIVGIFDQQQQFLCTGTLIRENVVLTAAHCVVSKPSKIKIIFGIDAFSSLNAREVDVQQESVRRVVAAKVNEKYVSDESKGPAIDQNDIAVLKFDGPLPAGFKPATLLTDDKELVKGVEATVAGYGVSHVDVSPIDLKQYGQKKLQSGLADGSIACDETQSECYEVDMGGDGTLRSAKAKMKGFSESEIHLDESKGQGTCSGDSGGPAFIQKNGNYLLFGVTSRGNLLCNDEGIYTSAVAHGDWIQKAIQSL